MSESFEHRGVRIERHGKKWRWRVRDGTRRVVRSASTFEEARGKLDSFLVELSRHRVPAVNALAVGDLCDAWFSEKKARIAPGTVQQYDIHIRVHIKPAIGDTDANQVKPRELEAFYASLRWKAAKESHNILRQAFDWGLKNEVLSRSSNPCLVVRPSRRSSIDHDGYFDVDNRIQPVEEKDIPTPEVTEKLLVDAESRGKPAWWLYLKVATATGARPGEVCALRRRDFDLERRTVRIEWNADRVGGALKRPKTVWSIRTLPLAAEFFEAIHPLLPDDPDAFLFPSNTQPGARSPLPCWNSRSVERRLDAALKRIGADHFGPHAFRHYVATYLLDMGMPPLQVARFLGHANDQLVRTLYANHIVDETQRMIGEVASRLHTETRSEPFRPELRERA